MGRLESAVVSCVASLKVLELPNSIMDGMVGFLGISHKHELHVRGNHLSPIEEGKFLVGVENVEEGIEQPTVV